MAFFTCPGCFLSSETVFCDLKIGEKEVRLSIPADLIQGMLDIYLDNRHLTHNKVIKLFKESVYDRSKEKRD